MDRAVRMMTAALLVLLAGIAAAAAKTLTHEQGEAAWISAANEHQRHAQDRALLVGNAGGAARALVKFDITTRMANYTGITQAVLTLTLAEARGNWQDEAFVLYEVRDGRWGGESATWASANDSDIIMLNSGVPIRESWNKPGCDGWSRGAKLAEAKISSADKGKTIQFIIKDPTFLKSLRELAHSPDPRRAAGFLIMAPGLEGKGGGAAGFSSWKGARDERPRLELAVIGYAPPKTTLQYTLKKAGRVSIVIFNEQGKLVRELLHGVDRPAGDNREGWDGKDELGAGVPNGKYSWKLLRTDGLQAEYLLTLGTRPKNPWGHWPGNHNPVTTVAADESGMYFAAGSNEGPPMLMKFSPNEEEVWEIDNFNPFSGAAHMFAAAGKLFMIETKSKRPNRLNAKTGKRESTLDSIPAGGNPLVLMDLCARDGRLLVSYMDQDVIRWFDYDGKQLSERKIPRPAGVALLANGDALVIAKGAVHQVPIRGAKGMELIPAAKLVHPWRLAIAPDGDLIVAEGIDMLNWARKDLQEPALKDVPGTGRQVKRFSAAGVFKAAYGDAGGRPKYGRYQPEKGFGNLVDVAVRPDGRILAVDLQGPARTAMLNPDGRLLREWYGGQTYGPAADPDPADPTMVYLAYGWGGIIRYRVDYVKRTWTVDAVFDTDVPMWKGDNALHLFIRQRGGKTFVCPSTTPLIFELDEQRGKLIPLTAMSFPAGGGPNPPDSILAKMKPSGQWKDYVFSWQDRNGDARMDDDEFIFPPGVFRAGGMYVDDDFNWYLPLAGGLQQWAKITAGYARITPVGTNSRGIPYYDNAKQEQLGEPAMDLHNFGNFEDVAVWKDTDGSVYNVVNSNNEKKFGQGFWAPRTGGNRVAKWNAKGKLEWVVGRHSATGGAAPGEARYFWRIMGTVNNCIVVGDMENSFQHVWDQDGLWVGRLLERPVLKDAPPWAFQTCGEQFGGSIVKDPKTGDVYFYGSGINNIPVFRITGWDGWTRQDGIVKLQ